MYRFLKTVCIVATRPKQPYGLLPLFAGRGSRKYLFEYLLHRFYDYLCKVPAGIFSIFQRIIIYKSLVECYIEIQEFDKLLENKQNPLKI